MLTSQTSLMGRTLLSGTLILLFTSATYADNPDTKTPQEAVIGLDTRHPINTPYDPPYNAVARITLGGKAFCTGFLISPDTLVTAGHCLQNWIEDPTTKQLSRWDIRAEHLKIYPGFDGNETNPFLGSCTVKATDTLKGWREKGDPESDLGVMKLDCSQANLTNQFQFKSGSDKLFEEHISVTLSGYHGDKSSDYRQWESSGAVIGHTPNMIFYDNDTTGGSSGSPVWVWSNGLPVVVAIHTSSWENDDTIVNGGVRLTPDIVRQLKNVILK